MTAKVYFFIQARLGSTRLPGKLLEPVSDDRTLIELVHDRLQRSKHFAPERTYFLTTTNPRDDALVAFCERRGWQTFRGDEERVFLRFQDLCREVQPDYFFRICSDNPFLEPAFLDQLGDLVQAGDRSDYLSFVDAKGTPVIRTHYGFFAELVRGPTFLAIDAEALSQMELEHVTPVFYGHPERFRLRWLSLPSELENPNVRLTVDTAEDLELARKIIAKVGRNFNIYDVYALLQQEPTWLQRMQHQIKRNEK